jgi:O-antigen ligase
MERAVDDRRRPDRAGTTAANRGTGAFPTRAGGSAAPLPAVVGLACTALVITGALFAGPMPGPTGLLFTAVGCAAAALLVVSPTAAMLVLLLASFTRLAIRVPALPSEPMIFALIALIAAAALGAMRGTLRPRFGPIEAAMAGYLLWNLLSVVWPHELAAVEPGTGAAIDVLRFIVTGTVLPFVAFVVARAAFRTERTIRPVLLLAVVLAAYSAVTSVLAFTGPTALVWPSYIVESPDWEGRAVGILNQPVVNGLVMVTGFVIALFLAREPSLARAPRLAALLVAVLCVPGIYLTKTRAVWLVFGVTLVLCAIFARGARAGFVVTISGAVAYIATTWTTFTSSNRAAGGVGSEGEINDRLNSIATSLWAIEQKPVMGWGISRFTAVNTYYHQQWAPNISFTRGYAISSHQNELGIATELGLVGLALWLAVLIPMILMVLGGMRRLPVDDLIGRRPGLIALTVLGGWLVCGLTVDLRFFSFANLLVFLLVGAAIGMADRRRETGDPVAVRELVPFSRAHAEVTA